jgi:hypothetical protein
MGRALFLLLLLLAALAPAACGGKSSAAPDATPEQKEDSAQSAVSSAGDATRDKGSAKVSFVVEFKGGPTPGRMTGEGGFEERKGRLTVDMSGLRGGALSSGGKVELIFDELVYYMKFPLDVAASLPGGKQWIKMDLAKIGKRQGIDLEQLSQLNQSDPSQALDFLAGASSDFSDLGTEDVRGVETTHYRGTIDMKKVVEGAPEELRDSYRRLLEAGGDRMVPMEAWVDGEGLVRRLRVTQTLERGAEMTMTEELYDFGTDVDTDPPPESEVLDLTELIGS